MFPTSDLWGLAGFSSCTLRLVKTCSHSVVTSILACAALPSEEKTCSLNLASRTVGIAQKGFCSTLLYLCSSDLGIPLFILITPLSSSSVDSATLSVLIVGMIIAELA